MYIYEQPSATKPHETKLADSNALRELKRRGKAASARVMSDTGIICLAGHSLPALLSPATSH